MGLEALALLLLAPLVGSFIGVLVDRLPESRPVAVARSTCDVCGAPLTAWDLVPIFSWLARGGRCRCRRARLRAFYPLIELAALAVALWATFLLSGWLLLATAALGWTLLALAVIDWRHELLPDALTLPLIPAGLAVAYAIDPDRVLPHAIGAAAGFLAFAALALAYERLRGREGLGLGDAKLLAAAGAWLGWAALPSVVVVGAVSGLLLALLQAARGRRLEAGSRLPFGPHLALGFWLVWLYGPLQLA
jgi:leader peptidase (prepilin peptidase) / N-methyltransferase